MNLARATTAAVVVSPYLYNFNVPGTLQEAGSMGDSASPYWWVDSGAYLSMYGYTGHTSQGSLPDNNYWRLLYDENNPVDTDNGYHPQNIFRLLTRSEWQDESEQSLFLINNVNLSASPNRNQSNGLLLFSRYADHDDLYYAGVRVDGAAVIKKKQNGIYYTLAYTPNVFPGIYDHGANPDLIPIHRWLGLKMDTVNEPDGSVHVSLYLDRTGTGAVWEDVAEATDTVGGYGTAPMTQAGYSGIRTDFMDMSFDNFWIWALP